MKAIYLDAFSGISGNMLLGAFLAAGVPVEHLKAELEKLPVGEEYVLKVTQTVKCGIVANYADVELTGRHVRAAAEHFAHGHEHEHHHHHRTFASVRAMIESSSLAETVKMASVKIFDVLAEAEGKVHGKPKDEVAFHEVGATDSIVDIVGAAICLDYMGIEKVFVSKVNVGSGFVKGAHGLMPVPAPATAELLKTFPFYRMGVEKELATPTGVAFLRAFASYSESLPEGFKAESIAYGAGTHELTIPNVLRLYVGELEGGRPGELSVLETNIDDMNPQIYGYLMERLFEADALDVWTTSIYMKKNRPAVKLSVLTSAEKKKALMQIIFRETTTGGIREMPVAGRKEAVKSFAQVETKYGAIAAKISAVDGKIVSVSPEYDDCLSAAMAHEAPLKEVQQEVILRLREKML